ncbi:MAG: sensor domain-containing diguanylate cyclase [Burkholderiaceae bacterium]
MPQLLNLWKKYRLLTWLSALLVIGFLATSIASYIVSRDTIRRDIAEQGLPLTGDSIYSEIQKGVLQPTFISSLMAHNSFLRDWILDGEQDTGRIVRYLAEVKQKYGTVTSFLVSDRSHKYYYAAGMLKSVSASEKRDAWFFRVRDMQKPYEINVDYDLANRDAVTIFINYKVLDYQGKFIGATGVGLTLDTLAHTIDTVQQRFQRSIYFVTPDGTIIAAGKTANTPKGSIYRLPGIAAIAGQIINHSTKPTQLMYRQDHATVLVNSRFIPELGWYLVVSQNEQEAVRPLQRVFIMNLVISAVVTLLVLMITLFAVNRFRHRLESAAAIDAMTGLLNRQAFEFIFEQARSEVRRKQQALSTILIDIDLFKLVNDNHGHLAGDALIRSVAATIKAAVRDEDVISRWGGEEFLLLLKDCPLQQARAIAENLRRTIAEQPFSFDGKQVSVSVSIGVGEYVADEQLTGLFARADAALYRAKAGGRNRVEIAAGQSLAIQPV